MIRMLACVLDSSSIPCSNTEFLYDLRQVAQGVSTVQLEAGQQTHTSAMRANALKVAVWTLWHGQQL